ncbi:hypothetical protein B7463_g7903, partial [Scytalidium lignicola]
MVDFKNPQSSGTIVQVSVLPTGWLYLPDTWIFADGKPGVKYWSPDFSFLVRHPSGKNVLFDLGMRKDFEKIPVAIQVTFPIIEPYVPKDAFDLLMEGPVHPREIHAVILSHLHFDHVGDVNRFPYAEIIAGAGARAEAGPGWPEAQASPFDSSVLLHPKYRELPESGPGFVAVGNFPKAYDYFGDGSFYLLDAPGHMAGHQMGLARTGENEWIVMGGDCCHHNDLVANPLRSISVKDGPGGAGSGFHRFPDLATSTIEKLRVMRAYSNVLTVLAHDASVQGKVPLYPYNVNGWNK